MKTQALNSLDRARYTGNLKGRASLLLGAAGVAAHTFISELCESFTSTAVREEREKAMQDLVVAARAGNAEAISQLAEMRINTVQNFLLASSNPLAFFELENLGESDVPYVQNNTRHEIGVTYLGSDGQPKRRQAVKSQTQEAVDLHLLSTDDYEYPLVDLQKGRVKDSALAQVNMADDLARALNVKVWPFVKASVRAFVLSGSKVSRTFVPHSSIVTANLPTTNLLVPTGNGAATKWRQSCMNAVLQYCGQWGSDAFLDGEISPVVVYVPSSELMGFLETVDINSSGSNKVKDQIFDTGYVVSYGGRTWTLVGDSTLDPAAKMAYVRTNKPIGKFFTKTALDTVIVDESPAMQKQNKGSVSMGKPVGVSVPEPQIVNIMGVQYKS